MLSARIGVLSSHVYKSAMPARQPLVCIRHANTHAYGWREAEQIFLRLDADPYMVLGVSESSSKTEVKSQYYRLCRELHPDTLSSGKEAPRTLGISDAEWQEMGTSDRRTALSDQFIKVSGAYQVLSNKDLRDKYSMFKRGGSGVRVPRTPNSKGQRPYDPWADERPSMYGARPQTHEEKVHERRVKWGIFGFFGVLFVVTGLQRLMQYEDQLRIYGMENLKSMRMMSDARERAMEKWREVPPESIMEYEASHLQSQAMAAAAAGRNAGSEDSHAPAEGDQFQRLWPHGSGLGLIALLDDAQLCGVASRRRVADDNELAERRRLVQMALAGDRVIRGYMTQSSFGQEDDSNALLLPAPKDKGANKAA